MYYTSIISYFQIRTNVSITNDLYQYDVLIVNV